VKHLENHIAVYTTIIISRHSHSPFLVIFYSVPNKKLF
jgi:hypothetical protein